MRLITPAFLTAALFCLLSVGAKADTWGHKRFFLAALLILPIRGALYTLSDNPFWLVGVQLLDGVGAGYNAAFISLGAVAAIGAVICLLALPESRQSGDGDPRPQGKTAASASAIAAE